MLCYSYLSSFQQDKSDIFSVLQGHTHHKMLLCCFYGNWQSILLLPVGLSPHNILSLVYWVTWEISRNVPTARMNTTCQHLNNIKVAFIKSLRGNRTMFCYLGYIFTWCNENILVPTKERYLHLEIQNCVHLLVERFIFTITK